MSYLAIDNPELVAQIDAVLYKIEQQYPDSNATEVQIRSVVNTFHFENLIPIEERQATFPHIAQALNEMIQSTEQPFGDRLSFSPDDNHLKIMLGVMPRVKNLRKFIKEQEGLALEKLVNDLKKKPLGSLSYNDLEFLMTQSDVRNLFSSIFIG